MEFDVFLPLDAMKTSRFAFLLFPLPTAMVHVFISHHIQDHRRERKWSRSGPSDLMWFKVFADR